jgi:hypothetical protein
VAVAQEAAMLSDVNAAMNSRPSLVSPETCFITRAGDLELPDATDVESPEAVADLLRAMLGDADVPEALEALAYGPSTRDLSSDLAAFPVGNRRAVIARLATRAIAALTAPMPRMDAAPPPAAVVPRAPVPIPFPAPPRRSAALRGRAACGGRAAAASSPRRQPRRSSPRHRRRAAGRRRPRRDASIGPGAAGLDVELRRLRSRAVERERRNQRLFARLVGSSRGVPTPRIPASSAARPWWWPRSCRSSGAANPRRSRRTARPEDSPAVRPAAPATPAPSTPSGRPPRVRSRPQTPGARVLPRRVHGDGRPGRPRDAERDG